MDNEEVRLINVSNNPLSKGHLVAPSVGKKCLWIQAWFNGEFVGEIKVSDTINYKEGIDIPAIEFLNNHNLKLIWK